MKIMIVGGNGQLGSALSNILLSGACVLGPVPEPLREAEVLCMDLPELDISHEESVQACIQSLRPDILLNCAALTQVDRCEAEPDAAFRANALGARNLAFAAQKTGAKLLHVSTDYVFAGNAHSPYGEWDSCAPLSVYGKSKLLGEQYVRQFCARSFIVRTAWLYGGAGHHFVKTILKAARKDGHLRVVDDQRGNPTNVTDLAYHILKIAATSAYGVYHCTGNGVCSWYEFACKIVEYAHIPCDVAPRKTADLSQSAPRPTFSALDNQMLRCTVGDEMRDWQDALQAFIRQICEEDTL